MGLGRAVQTIDQRRSHATSRWPVLSWREPLLRGPPEDVFDLRAAAFRPRLGKLTARGRARGMVEIGKVS